MISKKVKIQSSDGMHMQPANEFVKLAKNFKSKIFISKNGKKVDGKSLLSILTLVASKGVELEIIADGSDENDAVIKLANLIENNFNKKEIKNETK
ncbi:HPr family phosphocarrier protein [candidate division KSB1 bacterium]|nr:HPr family phosphocarrier protein [candidate division KSB1 bacterium]MBL7093881.1 HPr family phosphocarrier protein [candidate division KSB1 bacterium]